tara:strand:+ start:3578 stop:4219 length:642 start_codon:yes stop_codon:yes gene_type:complete
MSELGYAKNMSPDDYEYYSGGMELDKDILTYAPKLWQSKQEKRNNRKSRYEKDATGLTSSEESEEEPPIVPKKNKKSGKKEYSAEQKAKLVARLKAGREKAKANRQKKKAALEPKKKEVVVNTIESAPAPPTPSPPPQEPKPQPKKEPGLRDYLSAIESRWEKRMSAVEARHAKELEAKAAPKPQPTAPKPQPAQPINIPPPRSVGRFKAAMW